MKKLLFVALGAIGVFSAEAQSAVKLYRYNNVSTRDHLFTTNWDELGNGKYGYQFEGVAAYVFSTQVEGTAPCYRYFNSSNHFHFYTSNQAELGNGKYGYQSEGVAFYAYSTAIKSTVPFYRFANAGNGSHFYSANYDEVGNGKYGYKDEGTMCYVLKDETTANNAVAASLVAPAQGFLNTAADVAQADTTAHGVFYSKGNAVKGTVHMYKQDYHNEGIPAEPMVTAWECEDGKLRNPDFGQIDSARIGDLFFTRINYRERGFMSVADEQMNLVRMLTDGPKASAYFLYIYNKSTKTYTHSFYVQKVNEKKPVDVQAGLWNITFKKQLAKLFEDCSTVAAKAEEKAYGTGKQAVIAATRDYNESCH